jgi:hypothetical protein
MIITLCEPSGALCVCGGDEKVLEPGQPKPAQAANPLTSPAPTTPSPPARPQALPST